jgi:phage terminase small subunit
MTTEVRSRILLAVLAGNYREVAGRIAGVDPSKLRRYLRSKDTNAVAFRDAIEQAECTVEGRLVKSVLQMGKKNLQAATCYLSHKFPERWADKSVELSKALKTIQELSRLLNVQRDSPRGPSWPVSAELPVSTRHDRRMPLTPRQQRFVQEYLIDLNATQAAIRAGYSRKSADKIGCQLLGKTRVYAEIERLKSRRASRLQITTDKILAELAGIAFSSINDYSIDKRGTITLASEATVPDAVRAVKHCRVKTLTKGKTTCQTADIELYDKLRALELCMKHLGMIGVDVDLEELIARLRQSADSNLPGYGLDHEAPFGKQFRS